MEDFKMQRCDQQGSAAVQQMRIVEREGELIVPLPHELVEEWSLRPGMELEVEIHGRCLTLLPPGKPPAAVNKVP